MRVFPCVLAIALIAQCAIAEDNEGELLVCSALATFCHGFSMMFGIVKLPRPPWAGGGGARRARRLSRDGAPEAVTGGLGCP